MVKNSSFFVVQGWMINDLGLKGVELLIYAIIYGFSQDGQSVFSGTASYLADWTGSTKQTVFGALKKLREKGYIERIEKKVNGVTLFDYKISQILQGVKNFDGGSQKILPGGSQKILPHNINIDNINNNINNNTSTPLAARDEKVSNPKKKNALQVFCNCVVANFEEDGSVSTDEQKRIWFKRNCRALSDILNFCEKDIERALFTIDETCKWLAKNNLDGGYEAVSRHLPEMHAKALKRINNGERWKFTEEQQKQIDELYGKISENITPEQAEKNKKEFATMLSGLVGGKL